MTSPAGGHERRDVDFRPVAVGALALLGVLLGTAGLMWALIGYYVRHEALLSPPASPLASYAPREPPAPRLQTDPLADLARLHASEDARLDGYAWVDQGAGRVRIPIERAMALLATDGKP